MTHPADRELQGALSPPVKRKRNSTGKLRATATRVTGGTSEVMLKVTGFGKGAGHVRAHLTYISRNGKLQVENDRGEVFDGKEQIKAFFADWEKDFGDGPRHKNQRDTAHMVLSMPESTDAESVRNAVRAFAKATFGKNHEYVFALHTDEPHPHCHLTVKVLGFDGLRLNPRKADLQAWREGFAEKLRDEGVDAEATPRRSRGVVRKAESNVLRHIELGDKTHAQRVSRVRAAKIKEAAQELSAEARGTPVAVKPWEAAIKTRQRAIRLAWLTAAAELEQPNSKLTFNNEEARNERPNYAHVRNEQIRIGHRTAALYQSRLAEAGRQAPPGTLTGLRNLSSIRLVHHRRLAEMLLQPHALDRVGRDGGTDSSMRRTGTSPDRHGDGTASLDGGIDGPADSRALAARIRMFVAAMPHIDTELHQIKQRVAKRFSGITAGKLTEVLPPPSRSEQRDGGKLGLPELSHKELDR